MAPSSQNASLQVVSAMRRFHLVLLASVVAAQLMAAPPLNQPAPDFALQGATPSLQGLRGRSRVVILFAPAGKAQGIQGMKWNAQRQFFSEPAAAAGLAERNVVVVVVSDSRETWPRSLAVVRPAGDGAKIRAEYHVHEGQFLAVLVGKDGDVKDASTQPFQAEPLFALIDGMPMRRQEMKGGK